MLNTLPHLREQNQAELKYIIHDNTFHCRESRQEQTERKNSRLANRDGGNEA